MLYEISSGYVIVPMAIWDGILAAQKELETLIPQVEDLSKQVEELARFKLMIESRDMLRRFAKNRVQLSLIPSRWNCKIQTIEKNYKESNLYRHVLNSSIQLAHSILLESDYKQLRDWNIRRHLEADVLSDNLEIKSDFDKLSEAERITIWLGFPAERIERSIGTIFLFWLIMNYQKRRTEEWDF